MAKEKVNILLLNLGGPRSREEIRPFLRNLFRDPYIIRIPGGAVMRPVLAEIISRVRHTKSSKYYDLIGGYSPLYDIMQKQAAALKEALSGEFDAKVVIGMRYSDPDTESAIDKIPDGEKLIVLPMYPHFSETTTASSIYEFYRVLKKSGKKPVIDIITDFRTDPDYTGAFAKMINERMAKIDENSFKKLALVFSAHSTPRKLVEEGDPYYWHTQDTVAAIMEKVEKPADHFVSFQSKAGPTPWLEPATDDMIRELAGKGYDALIMVPVSFTADNLETLYEMDILFKGIADEVGIKYFERIPALNDDPVFIECLKKLVLESWKKLS